KPAAEESQDTISLDTKDKRYITYARVIKERISYHWTYPQEAKDNLMEGKLTVLFSLNRGGDLTQINIVIGSGYDILDLEALQAIRGAAPFPPFPEHITVGRLNIKATFDYRITTRR
ncbi:MAG: energy transducer TonB, partial [Desulfobacteraceae bacterium]